MGLVGKNVEIRNAQGSTVGNVTAISFASGEPRLTVNVNGTPFVDVRLSDVVLVR